MASKIMMAICTGQGIRSPQERYRLPLGLRIFGEPYAMQMIGIDADKLSPTEPSKVEQLMNLFPEADL